MDVMSIQGFKQYISHSLWFGEQKRHAKEQSATYTLINPDFSRVWGPDTSHWDGNVDFTVTKQKGASFVFIKAIDGTIQNSYFVPNRSRAMNAGLLHAPYGWLYRDANVSCVSQARAYSDIVKSHPSDLPPAVDFEWTNWMGSASNPNYTDLDKWATEWLRLGNRKPILYSAAGYMNMFGTIPAALKAKFQGIWIANYGVVNPQMPYGYSANEWLFHQFTSSGDAMNIAPGDKGKLELDLNYFDGTKEQLYSLAGQTTPPTEPPPTGGAVKTYYLTVTADPAKQFANPDGTNDVGPNLQKGTTFTSTSTNAVTYRNDSSGRYVKVAHVHLDKTVDETTPPVEPPPTTNVAHTEVVEFDSELNPISVTVDGVKFVKG